MTRTSVPSRQFRDVRYPDTPLDTGDRTTFRLGAEPIPGTEIVTVNGLVMKAGPANDYTLSGTTLTFASPLEPEQAPAISYLIPAIQVPAAFDLSNVSLASLAERSAAAGLATTDAVTAAMASTLAQGKHTVWASGYSLTPTTTNGATGQQKTEFAANHPSVRGCDFDATTEQYAEIELGVPKSADKGAVDVSLGIARMANPGNGQYSVRFSVRAVYIPSGGSYNIAYSEWQDFNVLTLTNNNTRYYDRVT